MNYETTYLNMFILTITNKLAYSFFIQEDL